MHKVSISNASEPLVLGLDVGGTKLAAGIVAADGTVLSNLTAASHADQGPEQMIARLAEPFIFQREPQRPTSENRNENPAHYLRADER